ncbi:MAG: SH3 domain-containing protein [Rickettsiales bacterium]|nr:SH3 domain-containing protein [Rickettsiales bacterium]
MNNRYFLIVLSIFKKFYFGKKFYQLYKIILAFIPLNTATRTRAAPYICVEPSPYVKGTYGIIFIKFLLIFFYFSWSAFAAQKIQQVNYFASLRSAETNVRAGPGQNYPIKFTYKLKGLPVHVISEYDNWNEIEDYENQTGWVSQSLLTKKRTLMVYTSKDFVNMHKKNNEKSRIIFHLENNVIGDYIKCLEEWCNIKINGKKGWVKITDLYGSDQ